jgi:ATP dependent DNA ligase domain
MLAISGALPAAYEDRLWAYELKWDGVRAVAYLQAGTVRLVSRNDLDVSVSYPEILQPPSTIRHRSLALDGELVTLDERGRPSFGRLQERMHVRDPAAARRLADRLPVLYYVFDLLYLDGDSLLQQPYTERRARLEDLDLGTAAWRVPPSFPGPAADVMAASRNTAWRASPPSAALPPTGRGSGPQTGARSSTSACRRSSSPAGVPGRAGAPTGSARSSSPSPTSTASSSMSVASAPASPNACSTTSAPS